MEQTLLTAVLLPSALGIIMLGLGLTLTIADFKRVVAFPKAVFIGLFCQMLLLPLVCFGIARAFALPPELAVGLMLLAASPGGATANLFSHLANGDVALNITLTAVNSVLSLLTLPFIVHFALVQFIGEGKMIPLQFGKVLQVFAIVLVPVAIGMSIRMKNALLANKLEKRIRIISTVALVLVIIGAVIKERTRILDALQLVGAASFAFNVASMCIGYFIPMAFKIPRKQAIAIGMEIGIHNAALAITVASSPLLLNNSMMAIPPAIYSVIMLFTAGAFGYLVNRRPEPEVLPAAEALDV
jgi:bile acid:Na+ symporter, BASS family